TERLRASLHIETKTQAQAGAPTKTKGRTGFIVQRRVKLMVTSGKIAERLQNMIAKMSHHKINIQT
ncbi:MAG: hypothetical protein LBK75_11885, partial [Oscillospiraceae bacterium]|nr:hypothetical protein [Oscillospiraceae bacterium]